MYKLIHLRQQRERYPLSMRELASKAGISLSALAELEAGRSEARASTVRKLAHALGVVPGALGPVQPALYESRNRRKPPQV